MRIYIDLLPEEKRKELRKEKIFKIILGQGILFGLPLIVFIIILLAINYILVIEKDAISLASSVEQSRGQYAELATYEKKFDEVNKNSQAIYKIQQGHLHWSNFFENLNKVISDGVQVSNISTKNYQVFVIGKARNRDVLLALKEKLDANECLKDVNVPLANLVVKNDVDFQIDFSVKEECLKK
jgi:Tfp pilus assembly protein PilN